MSPDRKHRLLTNSTSSPSNPVRKILEIDVPTNGNIPLAVGQRLLDAFDSLIGNTKRDQAAIKKLTEVLPDQYSANLARRRLTQYVQHVGNDSPFVHRVHTLLQQVEPLLPDTSAKPVGRITKHRTVSITPPAAQPPEVKKVIVQRPERPERSHHKPTTSVISKESFLQTGTSMRGKLTWKPQTRERSRDDD
jgi:hypothetical protein